MAAYNAAVKNLCVFCGSTPGARPSYAAAASRLGGLLAQRDIGLVYGGGNVGLMGVVADAVLAGGGRVLGVIPHFLAAKELAHAGATEMRVVGSMHERKAAMAANADAFVALPGGFGTMEELFEVLTWGQLGLHAKPVGLLDVEGFYASLVAFLDHAAAERLLKPEHRALLLVDTDPERLVDRLAAWKPVTVDKWLETAEQT